jgi:hypothetical protein
MSKENISHYDHTKDFKTECLQPIVKIKQFCISHGIPFYMSFATANNDKETEYITSKQLPPECDMELTDDRFRKIILAEHGFDLLINHVDSFDMDVDVCDGLLPPMEDGDIPMPSGEAMSMDDEDDDD